MGIEKAELKIMVAKDFGRQYALMAKSCDKEIEQIQGEMEGYKKVAQTVQSVLAKVDEDLDNGAFEGLDPLGVAKEVKKAVMRVNGGLENLVEISRATKFKTLGRLDGLAKASELAQKMAEVEQKKVEALVDSLEQKEGARDSKPDTVDPVGTQRPAGPQRPSSLRPGPSIAAQRRSAAVQEDTGATKQEDASAKKASKKTTKKAPAKEALPQKAIRTTAKGGSTRVLKSGGGAKKSAKKK